MQEFALKDEGEVKQICSVLRDENTGHIDRLGFTDAFFEADLDEQLVHLVNLLETCKAKPGKR